MQDKKLWLSWLLGITGSLLLFFIGWEYNIPIIGWISFPLLLFSFRSIPKWQHTLILIPLMVIVKFLCIYGGWDMKVWIELAFSAVVLIPLIAALYLDRVLYKQLRPLSGTFLFPAAYIIFDYLLTHANLGMASSLAYNQGTFIKFIQAASLFGSWFAGFVAAWFAPVAIIFIENITKLKKGWKPLVLYFTIFAVIMIFGNLRMVTAAPTKGVWTLYAFTDKVFPWIVFVGLVYLILEAIKNIITKKLTPKIFQFQRMR